MAKAAASLKERRNCVVRHFAACVLLVTTLLVRLIHHVDFCFAFISASKQACSQSAIPPRGEQIKIYDDVPGLLLTSFVNPIAHVEQHVGSFLRPKALLQARSEHAEGKLTADQLRNIENEHITAHVQQLLKRGIPDITDGEFRRAYFHIDFLKHLEGVDVQKNSLEQQQGYVPPTLVVTGKVRHVKGIEVDNFNFLKSIVPADKHHQIKVTIPSPTMLHFRGGRKGISQEAYPDLDGFFADVAAAYRTEVEQLYAAGCRYLQLDGMYAGCHDVSCTVPRR